MALTKRIIPVGNSAGLTLDKPVLKQVGWEVGMDVEIRVEGNSIVLTKYRAATANELQASLRRVSARHAKSLDKLGR